MFSLKKNYNSQLVIILPILMIYLKPGIKKLTAKN